MTSNPSDTAPDLLRLPSTTGVERLDDARLLALMAEFGGLSARVAARASVVAAEIARRSARDRGFGGLAQRTGDRTAQRLIARVAGTTGSEATTLVRAGGILRGDSPWLGEVARRVEDGTLTPATAAAIGQGLGAPSGSVDADVLGDAARELLAVADGVAPELLGRASRAARDELDAAGVVDRDRDRRDRRYLRLVPQRDGMTRIDGLLDPESAAVIGDAFDCVTAPRRGGPRFGEASAADAADDPRTADQIHVDTLVTIVRIAGSADQQRVFGSRKPAVRVHVTQRDLASAEGAAFIEGQTAPISIAAAERLACTDGYLPILFDDAGAVMNFGRTRRLFDENQRIALAAIWGGCGVEGCDRPPSWTEAHHVDHWLRDHGLTNVADGVLLCRFHHLLLHDNHWTLRRRSGAIGFDLLPPPDDPVTRPLSVVPKNPAWRRTGAA